MNPETGTIYRTPEEVEAARRRGEPLVEISAVVAQLVEDGRIRQRQLEARRRRAKAARRSRKRNRRA